jgi:hypothetical protein
MDTETMRLDSSNFDYERQSAALKPRYLRAWSNILSVFLGWTKERIDRWASTWEEGLNSSASEIKGWFYHETAEYYVVPFLIPDTLRRRLTPIELNHLGERLQRAITLGNSRIEFADDYDWYAAKGRVEAVLGEYGERLELN